MTTRRSGSRAEVLDIIKDEHQQVQGLFRKFNQEVQGDKQRALETCRSIVMELEGHTAREEEIVYPRLKALNEPLYYEAMAEHEAVEMMLGQVKQISASDPFLEARMMVIQNNVETHIEEEESTAFDQLRMLSDDELNRMANDWKGQKQQRRAA